MSTTGFCRRINLGCFTSFTRLPNARIISFSLFVLSFTLLARPAQAAPKAPTNLAATAVSTNQINLSWTDNSNNETAFYIERAPDSSGTPGTWAQIATVGANVTTYGDTGVSADTRYWYRVRAHNNGGDSAYSNQASATTAPLAPSNLTATAVSTNQINLSWADNSSTETGFKIERAPDNSGIPGTWAQIVTVSSNVTTYSKSGLSANTKYWYRVRAYNTAGDSAYSAQTNATTLPLPPAAPSGLTPTPSSSSQINLSWTDNSNNEDGFKIERAPDNSGIPGTWAQIVTVSSNVTTYSNSGLSANTKYWYRVRAYNTGGDSAYSAQTNATTPALVGWWKLDEGTGTITADSSGNAKDGSLVNGASWTNGFSSNAVLVSTTARVTVSPYWSGFDLTNSLTLSIWVKPFAPQPGDGSQAPVFANGNGYFGGWWLLYYPNTQRVLFQMTGQNGNQLASIGTIPTNRWTHLVATFDGSNARIYLNGLLDQSTSWTGQRLPATFLVELGGICCNATNSFRGVLDDARIYARALDANEIATLYSVDSDSDGIPDWWMQQYFGHSTGQVNDSSRASDDADSDGYTNLQEYNFGTDPTNSSSHPTAIPPNLVGWWKLDEATGTNTVDSSGSGNAGTLINNPSWASGIFSNAVQFDGSANDRYVNVPTNASLDVVNALTVCAWVNTTNSDARAVVSYRAAEYYSGWRLFYSTDQISFQWAVGGAMQNLGLSLVPLPSNQWAHVAAVFNPATTNVSLYLNGLLVVSGGSGGFNLTLTAPNSLKIGRCDNGNSYWFPGKIDDVRVYSRALNASEITALCNVDTVGDGIPDRWRQQYFGSAATTNSSSCASCNPDGDGLTNLQEYQHGTDPLQVEMWNYEVAWNPNSTNITISPTGLGNMYYTTDTVSIATSDNSNIRVFTFRGQQIYQGPPTNLSTFASGHYFVESAGTGGAMGDRSQFMVFPADYSGADEWGAGWELPGIALDYYTHLQRVKVGYVVEFSYWYNLTPGNLTWGQYDFTSVNQCLQSAHDLGAKAVFQMGFWPQFASSPTQLTVAAYVQYVTDLAYNISTNQYASSCYGFTLWNEPWFATGNFRTSVPDTNTAYQWPPIAGWDGGWTNWLAIMYEQAIPAITNLLPNAVILGENHNDFLIGDRLLSNFQYVGVLSKLGGESHHYYDAFGLPDEPNPNCYYAVPGGSTNVTLPEMLDRELSYYPNPPNTVWIMDESALFGSSAYLGATSSVLGITQFSDGLPFISRMDWWNGFCDAIKTAVIYKSRNVHPILHVGMRGNHNAGPDNPPYLGWAASPDQNGQPRLRGPYPYRSSWIAAWSWLNGATYESSESVQTNNTTLWLYNLHKDNPCRRFSFVWTLRGTTATYSMPYHDRVDVFGNALDGSLITDEPTLFIPSGTGPGIPGNCPPNP